MGQVSNSIMISSGGGGGTTITVVANYSALPDPTTVSGQFYWCSNSEGTKFIGVLWGGTYRNAGQYYSNGVSWEYQDTPSQATLSEVNTGTVTDKFVTPNTLKNQNYLATIVYADAKVADAINDGTTNIAPSQNAVFDALATKEKVASFMALTSAYVGGAGTSLQKLFNVGSGGAGAFNAVANKCYEFVCEFDLTAMSSSSGTFSFGFLGSATISSLTWKSVAAKGALSTASTAQITSATVGTATVITGAGAATTGKACVTGIIRVTGAGTIIPAFAVSVSATPQVEANSTFIIRELGSDTATHSSDIS